MLQAGNFALPPLSSTFPDNFLITLKGEKKMVKIIKMYLKFNSLYSNSYMQF